ncbi:TBCC domain-containing protein 1-like [Corticium candelabrum]|uniref:TBCC domain-containing protein 1-like n=1 Tax=Corticium candelabrum TaxID=121492 RepID=UPI002E25BE0E|nr:TBCC domain-containing protein 1-like [Corticium candelabrum]
MAELLAVWVRPEPFDFGICQIPPPSKLNISNLHRLAAYAKSKGSQGWPSMSYCLWSRCACSKLHMTEDQAQAYFECFRLVWYDHKASETLQWAKSYSRCKTERERDQLVQQQVVPVPQFLLFLHIQLSMKISLKSKLMSDDEWKLVPQAHDKRAAASKHSSEHTHMDYISNHLLELVQLLVEPDSYSTASAAVADQTISGSSIDALDYLLACLKLTQSQSRKHVSLREAAQLQSEISHSGYSKITHTFSIAKLVHWIRSHLTENLYGVSSTITNRHKLATSSSLHVDGRRKGRMISNLAISPNDARLVILAHIKKLRVMKGEDELAGALVRIQSCREAFVYLLAPMRHVWIDHCRNCTFILGAVQGIVHIAHCTHCTVIVMCGQLQIRECTQCVLHSCTPCKPILQNGNDGLMLGPYHTFYPALGQHMIAAGLISEINKWDSPIFTVEDDEASPSYQLLPHDDFYPFTVPYKMSGDLKENPCPLPPLYANALSKRKRSLESWYQALQEADLDSSQQQQLQSAVETQFHEWLIQTGNDIQLANS